MATFPGAVPTSGNVGWNNSFGGLGNRHVFAADRVTANKLYAYNVNVTNAGVYASTDGGANWSQVLSGTITGLSLSGDAGGGKLSAVPGQAGNLFWNDVIVDANTFMRSTDGGATWAAVNGGFTLVDAYGFGATFSGQSYPSIGRMLLVISIQGMS